eukprot:TRINITY_DN18271_c0_g1_i1.p1 TRINITY_DN18271_c0_g1~~TRINITY_DN18271_c0_g1_i1.p1  ORF type:complete len:354 (-),score=90.62 TRINITY_DN18271_c0_g1_i1:217-1278(-)
MAASLVSGQNDRDGAVICGQDRCLGGSAPDAERGQLLAAPEERSGDKASPRPKDAAFLASCDVQEIAAAAGHKGAFLRCPPTAELPEGRFLKPFTNEESSAYKRLEGDELAAFVPRCFGRVEIESRGEFLQLGDLLSGFVGRTSLIDCKMGIRTFCEHECANTKLREDLYGKLHKLAPEVLTPCEKRRGSITKLRYMSAREELSSSSTLGFRVDGVLMEDECMDASQLGRYKTVEEISALFGQFLEKVVPEEERRALAVAKVCARLEALAETLERSKFFKEHELIGSSLLFAVTNLGEIGVWMIDFNKVGLLPDDIQIDHRSQWQEGNHEDGYLIGLESLQAAWGKLQADSAT